MLLGGAAVISDTMFTGCRDHSGYRPLLACFACANILAILCGTAATNKVYIVLHFAEPKRKNYSTLPQSTPCQVSQPQSGRELC